MNFVKKDLTFLSSDGKNTIHATVFAPAGGEIKGVVQLSHGMIDYVGRYEALADYLTSKGYVFAGNEHLGHGRSAASAEDLGYFGKKYGFINVIDDLYKMNRLLSEEYEGKPIILFGHSMGSFIARLYAVKYKDSIDGIVIHGTGGKNPAAGMGLKLVAALRLIFGAKHRSKLINSIAFGAYNKKFDESEGHNAWLTRDLEKVATRDTDPYTSYLFTLAGYTDLFTMLKQCNDKRWYKYFPKSLPTLVMSGTMDPVGNYGKGVLEVHEGLKKQGLQSLTLKMYDGARHELFNEFNREEVFSDLCSWLDGVAL